MNQRIKSMSILFIFMASFCKPVPADSEDPRALYGEAASLITDAEPVLKSGHDALRPITDAMQGYYQFKDRLREDVGLAYTFEYAPQFQWDARFNGTHHSNDETNVIVQWSPIEHSEIKRGSLIGWYQVSRTLGSLNTSSFMEAVGVISPLNGGDTAPESYRDLIQMLTWEQWFINNRLRMGAGKLTTRTFLNLNRYATGDREDFFTPMLVNNPVVPFTARNGLGIFGQYHLDESYVTAMLREADGTSEGIEFSNLDTGKWEYALELGLTPASLWGLGGGYYRFAGYYTDSIGEGDTFQPSGWALALSFDQDIGKKLGAVFRYSWASEDYRAFKQRVALGLQVKHPLRFQNDRIGIGAWWGDPTVSGADGEYGLETYWKLQLAPYLEVTPDLQFILNPQGDKDRSSALVFGLRVRVVL